MNVLIVIGDQDTYHEDADEVVSSPIWLADILSDEGVTGLFVIQSRRAEILAEQGRSDVITALRRHEIGLHGRDVHPVLPEVVEGLGWSEGVEALMAVEGAELELLGRVFEVAPVCLSQHRSFAAPQVFALARRFGIPYLFGYPSAPPTYSLSWYAGALNVPCNSPAPEFLGFFPGVFDDALHDDAAFANLLNRLRKHIDRCHEVGLPLLVVFVCHPERLCYAGPLELWQYGNGLNHGRSAVPAECEAPRSRAEITRSLVNFRTLVRYLRDAAALEPITVSDMIRRYGRQAPTVSCEVVADMARKALHERQIPIGAGVSAAEGLLGFADSLCQFAQSGRLPESIVRRDVLGPIEAPPLAPEVSRLEANWLITLAGDLVATSIETGHLPAALQVDGGAVGLGTLFGAFAEAYLATLRGNPLTGGDVLTLGVWPRYPQIAFALGERQRLCAEDPLVRPGLATDAPALHTRLQTWTLKPASRA